MKLNDYKLVFVVIGLIGVLLIATPALAGFIHLPGGEQFSELYLLGPNQMAENYPFNIAVDQELLGLCRSHKPNGLFPKLHFGCQTFEPN